MPEARFALDPAFVVGAVNPRLFGSFVEHMGRCVYTGIFEPGHPSADPEGLRTDVLALIREMGVTTVRYPGGNFVSGYNWEDGIGPKEKRPRRLDLAWRTLETNQFGLDEFIRWCKKADSSPMMAVNLGTRGLQEACDLLEYSNHPGGTRLSDLRVANGSPAPFAVPLWCLGNEMDGDWQTGHKTAAEYGRVAAETARAMRAIDPEIRLVACGSSNSAMGTFAAWEATVLEECYDVVDYVSLHAYYQDEDNDPGSFLASAVDMEYFIESVVATCDFVGAKLKNRKRLELSFDEWNVWYFSSTGRSEDPLWAEVRSLAEDTYTVTDAVVVGSLLIALLRHCDRVTAASLAQLVNVIAPITTVPGGEVFRQTTFYPFAAASRFGRGQVLRVEPSGPSYSTARFGDVPLLHATAVQDEGGAVTVFAVNRSTSEPLEVDVDLRGLGDLGVAEHRVLADEDRLACNTAEYPGRVRPQQREGALVDGGRLTVTLPPVSWNVIRLLPRSR